MPKRSFNWKFVIVLVLAFAVMAITAYTLRQWNRGNRAATALELGSKAYEQGNWKDAADNLGRYISVMPDDVSVLLKYADAQLNIRPLKRNNVKQTINAYRQVLRKEKGDPKITEKLIEIYLQMNTPAEAEFIARESLKISQTPKIRRMLAMILIRQGMFKEASSELNLTVEKYPEEILAYEALAQLAEQFPED